MEKVLLYLLISISFFVNAQVDFNLQLADSAAILTKEKVVYNPEYFSIKYPNGDIPSQYGVCTDVVIRAYRKMKIDLQKEVHEDMLKNFSLYPKNWGLNSTDKNIDHRRVPNLMTFFTRHGKALPNSSKSDNYIPGDIVCWNLGGGINHIGMVVNKKSIDGKRFLIIHNIGSGQVIEDVLFDYTIIGHYQYQP